MAPDGGGRNPAVRERRRRVPFEKNGHGPFFRSEGAPAATAITTMYIPVRNMRLFKIGGRAR
jgi:hypothetical protein